MYTVTKETKENILRIIRKVDGATGFAVNSPDALAIMSQQQGKREAFSLPLGVTLRVKLTQTGGSAGTKTTAVSFTYTIKTLDDAELATAKAPEWPSRSENGLKTAATQGLAYRDTTGTWQIAHAFEKSGTGGC